MSSVRPVVNPLGATPEFFCGVCCRMSGSGSANKIRRERLSVSVLFFQIRRWIS